MYKRQLKNWLLYYSIEKICSYLTDVLITINQEDYALAKKKMRAKRIEYVPGVGIDLEKYSGHKYDKMAVRHEWAIPKGALVLVSVGELNTNKNHEVIIRALKRINLGNALYFICGTGEYEEELKRLVHNLGLDDKVRFLGYRTDIDKILCSADIFCFPSKREGLGLAAIEAMTSGLPILTSNVHGIKDYSVNGISGYSYSPMDVEGFAEGIMKLAKDETLRNVMGERNKKAVITYSLKNINFLMEKIYREI